jgi:hypothetical protein
MLTRVTTPVPTRFSPEEITLLDELVAAGVADAVRRAKSGAAIATSYRERPQSTEDDELALASAIAMTVAEPW